MKIKKQLALSRLVGKIDNDFNISESDWIPRVAAWTIDALSQMKVLPMQKKRRELEVSHKIAQFPCCLNADEIKVYTKDGCEIPELNNEKGSCGCNSNSIPQEFAIIDVKNKTGNNFMQIVRNRTNVGRNYVLDGNNIEINFDTDFIIVESYEVATYYDEYYDCQCPYIYDNGLLLEALAWYCLYKYLSRGSHHQVYDLKSQNPSLNPYLQWTALKNKAATSVKIDISNGNDGWNNFFYNSTFLPRG